MTDLAVSIFFSYVRLNESDDSVFALIRVCLTIPVEFDKNRAAL